MKIVFLDRDGVINRFPGNGNYVTKLKDFHFLPGSLDAIRILTEMDFTIFVISNQAGVARGFYTKEKLKAINKYMLKEVRKAGGKIKKVYYCTHSSDAGCDCRKPNIGNLRKALSSVNRTIRYSQTKFFVGDTKSDILTGHRAGCNTILVLSGRASRRNVRWWGVKPDFIVKDLFEATKIIADRKLIASVKRGNNHRSLQCSGCARK